MSMPVVKPGASPGASGRSMLTADDRDRLAALAGDELRFDEPMARRTTLRIGGPADALVTPVSVDQLRAVLRACASRDIPVTVIGGGSNLLVRDGGVRGVVVATRKLRGIVREHGRESGHGAGHGAGREDAPEGAGAGTGIRVESGVSTGKLLSMATQWELGGVEFLGGVPGSVGGGMRMNAGTYLGEFKDVTVEVTTVRIRDGELVVRPAAACGFAYRSSAIPLDEIVVEARLALRPRPRADIEADVRALRKRRDEREPKKVSNAGSTFKNPPGDFAGRLIEACGLKGTRIGGAECSPVHANWLVNTGDATAADLLALIALVRDRVQAVHGIALEMEVKVIGED